MSSSNQTIVIMLATASQAFVVCSDLTEPPEHERALPGVEHAPATAAAPSARKAPKRFVACYEPETP